MEAFKSNQETSNSYFTIILLSYCNVVVRFVIHILTENHLYFRRVHSKPSQISILHTLPFLLIELHFIFTIYYFCCNKILYSYQFMWNCFLFLKNVFFRYNIMMMMLTRDTSLLQLDFIFLIKNKEGKVQSCGR